MRDDTSLPRPHPVECRDVRKLGNLPSVGGGGGGGTDQSTFAKTLVRCLRGAYRWEGKDEGGALCRHHVRLHHGAERRGPGPPIGAELRNGIAADPITYLLFINTPRKNKGVLVFQGSPSKQQ